MFRSLLFTGLLINRSKVKPWLQWLHTVSFFHAAFEALAVNELRFLQLKEDKVCTLSIPCIKLINLTRVYGTVRSRARRPGGNDPLYVWTARAVVLVAKHHVTGHFLRHVHRLELCCTAFLCPREAVNPPPKVNHAIPGFNIPHNT